MIARAAGGWLIVFVLFGCAGQQSAATSARGGAAAEVAAAAKRIVISIPNEPVVLYHPMAPSSSRGSASLVYDLINPGLSASDSAAGLRPLLIEAVPSVENGLWRVLPDGHMRTTWQLKPGVTWHDGASLTTDDLAFSIRVAQDRDLPLLRNRNADSIESVAAEDGRTLVVGWSRPFIEADQLFTNGLALPLPTHLLEEPFARDKG